MAAELASVFVHLEIKRKLEHRLRDQKQPPSRGGRVSRSHVALSTTDPPSSHIAESGGHSHCVGDISGSFSRRPLCSAIVLVKLAVSSSPVQPVISESLYAEH